LNMIFVVRKRLLEDVLNLWQDYYIEVFDVDKTRIDEVIKIL